MNENTCEHGDHSAPAGQRFCSEECEVCERTDFIVGTCAGICVSKMRAFEEREIFEARDYARDGGQALHCHYQLGAHPPKCFVRDVNAGKAIGHLFDQSWRRLVATARRLGVRVVAVERGGQPLQHVDLCGKPMERALKECGAEV